MTHEEYMDHLKAREEMLDIMRLQRQALKTLSERVTLLQNRLSKLEEKNHDK